MIADPQLPVTASPLGRVAVGQIGLVALLRVNYGESLLAECAEQRLDGRHDRGQTVDVVAQRVAKAARLDEVSLHVDDHERRVGRIEDIGIRLGRDSGHEFL